MIAGMQTSSSCTASVCRVIHSNRGIIPAPSSIAAGSKSSQTIAAKKRNTTSAVLTYRAALLPKANRNGNSTAVIKSAATTSKNSMVPSMDMYKTIFSASSSFLIPPRTNLCKTTRRFASV